MARPPKAVGACRYSKMGAKRSSTKRGNAPVRPEDFQDPIGFLYGEHARIGRCCAELAQLAEDPAAPGASESAASVLDFLENELPVHVADEEEDLFPLLRDRLSPGDEVVSVIEILRDEHRDDIECGRSLIEPLRRIAAGRRLVDRAMFTRLVHAFTSLQLGHHKLENDVVLRVAGKRLSADDIAQLGRSMAARRGVSYRG